MVRISDNAAFGGSGGERTGLGAERTLFCVNTMEVDVKKATIMQSKCH